MTPTLLATIPTAPGMTSVFMLPKFLALAAYLSFQSRGWRKMPREVNWGIGIYLGTQVLSAVFSLIPALSWAGVFRDHSTGVAADCLLISLFYLKVGRKEVIRGLRWAGGITAVSGLLWWLIFVGRANGFFIGSPVYSGAVLAICAPHLPWVLPALIVTYSRGALGAAAAGLFIAHANKKITILILAMMTPALVGMLGVGAIRATSMSDSGRIALYKTAWASFKHRPLLGHGPSTFVQSIHAHNQGWNLRINEKDKSMVSQIHAHNWALELLASSGLVGLLGFLTMLALVGRNMQGPLSLWGSLLAGALISCVNPLGLPAKALWVMCAGALVREEDA